MKKLITVVGVLGFLVAPNIAAQNPPPASRAFAFADTLGANFSIGDSATKTGTAADFDFLVGTWHFRFQNRRSDGTFSPAFSGHWMAEKKRTANAFLEDHFRADNPATTIDQGTWTYRVFNSERKLWEMQGVRSEDGAWAPGLCWSDDANRYVIQAYGPVLIRIRYFNITANEFQWRADITNDSGKTWIRDWLTMEAKRYAK